MENEKQVRPFVLTVVYCNSEDCIPDAINRIYKKTMSNLYTFEVQGQAFDMFGEKYYKVRMQPKSISINVNSGDPERYRLMVHACGNSPKWHRTNIFGVRYYQIKCSCGLETCPSQFCEVVMKKWQEGDVIDVKSPLPPCDRNVDRVFDEENLISGTQ